jgi:DNA-binding CsgD family transcriptional regulator
VKSQPAFTSENLIDLSAICSHLSASLALARSQSYLFKNSELANRLTKRELEIALLVAQGLTNVAIAKQLWITHNSVKQALKRIFRKIDVSSRVEMVAKLQLLNNK